MKNIKLTLAFFGLSILLFASGCSDDDEGTPAVIATASAGADQSVDLDATVTLNGSASENATSYAWTVIDPNGAQVSLSDAADVMPTFVATLDGDYMATVNINGNASLTGTATITVNNANYVRADYMGRPAINTVFNFFGTSGGKDDYNTKTLPSAPLATSEQFEFIFDNLQEYVGLTSDTYTNVLGLNNTQTSGVLIVDALNSNKDFPTTYGPSDPSNIGLFENVLNGRGLSDDVVDVTLILTFGGDLSSPPTGLIGDNVGYTSNSTNVFPYLGSPN